MSALHLYRGPDVVLIYKRRVGSPLSVSMTVGGQLVMHATPSDFITLRDWLRQELATLEAFMDEPEDPRVAENMRGDTPE